MSSIFLKSFAEKPPRETSGSRSANRFDYQKNWSLCELLSLHTEKEDYLMVLEHHEDVVVFDAQADPTSAIFYQVKTQQSGNWTIGSLTKSKDSGSTQSIIGKLYSNYLHFSDNVENLVFTSNQGLSAKLSNGEKGADCECITFKQLSLRDKEKIQQAAEGTDQDFCDLFGLSKITFLKTDLRIADHTAITKGKLVEFFENRHPDKTVHISLVYKTIFDEIRRKNNYEKTCSDVEELCTRKSIGRTEFDYIVNVVLQHRSTNDLWQEAHQLLSTKGYEVLKIRQMRSEWQRYVVDRMDVSNEPLMEIQASICSCIAELEASGFSDDLKCLSKQVLGRVKSGCDCKYYNDAYIEAAIICEVIINDPVPKISTKSTEGAK